MLLFEHKQYLQSYDAESSMQMEISSFKILAVSNKLLPGFVTSQTQIKPRPREHATKGARPCCAVLEKRKSCCHAVKTRGARKHLFIYESQFCLLTILMDSQVSKSMF